MAHHSLAGPKIDQRPTDKTATDLVGQLRRFKADGSSAPATAPVEPSEMPGGVITKHDSHVAADPPQQDVIVSHSNPDPVASAVVLAQAAQLAKPGFRADATHLELAYRVHRILVAANKGELVVPNGVDREAVRRFVDEAFFATQFLDEDIHSEAKARANRPYTTDPSSATGVLGVSETTDRENDVCRPSWDAGGAEQSGYEARVLDYEILQSSGELQFK